MLFTDKVAMLDPPSTSDVGRSDVVGGDTTSTGVDAR